MKRNHFLIYVLIGILSAQLLGCSGGDDGGDVIGTGLTNIRGTAAVGDAIVNATVTLKSNNGAERTATTNATGKFELDIAGIDGPYLMKVSQPSGPALFSIAASQGVTNIHPFTDLIIRNWFLLQGIDIDTEFNSINGASQLPDPQEIIDIEEAIRGVLSQALIVYSLQSSNTNLLSTDFNADGTGFDRFLKNNRVVIIDNQVTIIIRDPLSTLSNELVSNKKLGEDFRADTTNPYAPSDLRAISASQTEVVVVWQPANDNVGIAKYEVHRITQSTGAKTLSGTTPFPVFTDTGLTSGETYCYEVVAFDGAGNMASASISDTACPQTAAATDITPPPAPTSVMATTAGSGEINLTWTQTAIDDVVSFDIYRGPSGSITDNIATVAATSFLNIDLLSDTEYCYEIVAVDAAGNPSARSTDVACARTNTSTNPLPTGETTVTFSSGTYQASETSATVAITVTRAGAVDQATSVNFTTSDGSATTAEDYVATSGQLNWAIGDSAAKTFYVQIKADTNNTEGNETVNLTLSNPTGAIIGVNGNSTLTIADATCNGVLDAAIDVDTTITDKCVLVTRIINVNGARLTISPGVTMLFQANTALMISSGSTFVAAGTIQSPILLTGTTKAPGHWYGLRFGNSSDINNLIDHTTVEFAGGQWNGDGNIALVNSYVSIVDSTINQGSSYGLEAGTGSTFSFSNNTIKNNQSNPIALAANNVGSIDASSRFFGNQDTLGVDKNFINVTGGSVTSDQTWVVTAIPFSLRGHSVSANLEISPGVKLIFSNGGYLGINSTGSFKAEGTIDARIVLTSASATPGAWFGLRFLNSNNNNNSINFATIEFGGGQWNGDGTIATQGAASRFKISNSTISNSSSVGIQLAQGTILDGFTNNTVTSNALQAIQLPPNLLERLDSTSTFTGNGINSILVTNATVDAANTAYIPDGILNIRNIGVDYQIGNLTTNAPIVVEPGVKFIVDQGGVVSVNGGGVLRAIGTPTDPIIFTANSLFPAAGWWRGLHFMSGSVSNIIENAIVEYGGTAWNGTGNIVMSDSGTSATVNNTVINESSTYGIHITNGATLINDPTKPNTFSNNIGGDICNINLTNPCP